MIRRIFNTLVFLIVSLLCFLIGDVLTQIIIAK